jgi:N-acetyl-anhydromuramyl-L-alanine amidase AmpD
MNRHIDLIVVHCSASPDYLDIGYKEIKRWHTDPKPKGNGWADIGYHYVIRRNGEIERGRVEEVAGAHAAGVNATSLGICWVGDKSPSPEQEKSLVGLINYLRGKYSLNVDQVKGHREAVKTAKTCPNINMDRLRAELVFVQPTPKVR